MGDRRRGSALAAAASVSTVISLHSHEAQICFSVSVDSEKLVAGKRISGCQFISTFCTHIQMCQCFWDIN